MSDMTLGEKKKRIIEHCKSIGNNCADCPLFYKTSPKEECFEDITLVPRNYAILFGDSEDPYWQRIEAIAKKQRKKGMDKYGVGLEKNSLSILKRIQHIEEELIDGLYYLEWAKEAIKEME